MCTDSLVGITETNFFFRSVNEASINFDGLSDFELVSVFFVDFFKVFKGEESRDVVEEGDEESVVERFDDDSLVGSSNLSVFIVEQNIFSFQETWLHGEFELFLFRVDT